MAKININFVGLWRVFLDVRSVTAEINNIDEARDYIETCYGSEYQKKLKSLGFNRKQSIWDNSNILLNGKNIRQLDKLVLQDGDKLDLVPRVAGG